MLALRHLLFSEVLYLISIDCLLAYVWIIIGLSGAPSADSQWAPVTSGLFGASMATVAMWSLGLYDRWLLFDRGHIVSRLVAVAVLGYVLVMAAGLLGGPLDGWIDHHLLWEVAAVTGLTASVAALHLVFPQVSAAAQLKRRLLVIGSGLDAAALITQVGGNGSGSFAIVAQRSPSELDQEPDTDGSLLAEAIRLKVDEIVVFGGPGRPPSTQLLRCRVHGIAVTDHQTFWERESGRVFLDDLQPAWLIFSDGFRNSRIDDAGKRAFDLLISLIGLVVTVPIMVVVAGLVALDSRGPVLYTQKRVGRHGREFVLYKFRSMRCDAERDGVPQWAIKGDPRVTRLGKWLRRLRLDELPQFINVLKGDMSLIGPRPERAYFVEQLSRTIPYYHLRHQVRPGLTGWAQVSYKYTDSVEDARIKFSYDLYYLKNRGLLLDLLIMLQTVQVVLFPKGVH